MIIATKAVNGSVNVFDVRKHSSFPRDFICRPNMVLTGHEKEGYGLSWSPLRKGLLASGSDDARVCVWDVCASSAASCTPIRTYCEQKEVVEVGVPAGITRRTSPGTPSTATCWPPAATTRAFSSTTYGRPPAWAPSRRTARRSMRWRSTPWSSSCSPRGPPTPPWPSGTTATPAGRCTPSWATRRRSTRWRGVPPAPACWLQPGWIGA